MPEAILPSNKTPQKVEKIRPTKKQRLLLEFISAHIAEHGYSPSYREIMAGCGYNSVATVALHVNNLIKRGHLQKRDRSARSLEVVQIDADKPFYTNQIKVAEEKWLVDIIEARFVNCENSGRPEQKELDNLYVLVGSLRVLGLEGAAQSFMPRLSALKRHLAG
jgi:SOS-response transcriptional repressor LexA